MTSNFLLGGLVIWCCLIGWSDWTRRRIPNVLLMAGFGCALLGLVFLGRTPFGASPLQCLIGALAGLLALLPFYILRIMGAGDVKLFATAGALLGWPALLPVWLIASVLAALHAVGWMTSSTFLPQLAASRYVGTFGRLPYGAHLAVGIAAVAFKPELIVPFSFGLFA